MATKLEKNLIRESNILIEDKNLMVTVCADQSIELKLKGNRNGTLKIGLLELFEYLGGNVGSDDKVSGVKPAKIKKSKENEKMISLYDLRSMSMISDLTDGERAKFDQIIVEIIKEKK